MSNLLNIRGKNNVNFSTGGNFGHFNVERSSSHQLGQSLSFYKSSDRGHERGRRRIRIL